MNLSALRPGGPTLPACSVRASFRSISRNAPEQRHTGMLSRAELRRAVAEMID
jgi:hypothetical protein